MSSRNYTDFKNNTYRVKSKSSTTLISVTDMKLYLRIDTSTEDLLIEMLIKSAVDVAEKLMNRSILETVWTNLRSDIEQDLTLRRAEFLALNSIEYMKDGSYVALDSDNYQIATGGIYAKVWEIELADSCDAHPEAIKIEFKTGYGASASSVPESIITAIKQHVAYMFENRGDCFEFSDGTDSILNAEKLLPITCALVYKMHRVVDVNGVI